MMLVNLRMPVCLSAFLFVCLTVCAVSVHCLFVAFVAFVASLSRRLHAAFCGGRCSISPSSSFSHFGASQGSNALPQSLEAQFDTVQAPTTHIQTHMIQGLEGIGISRLEALEPASTTVGVEPLFGDPCEQSLERSCAQPAAHLLHTPRSPTPLFSTPY